MREELVIASHGISLTLDELLDEPLETELTDDELEQARRRRIAEENQAKLETMIGGMPARSAPR